jgi:hypothetical protein
MNIGDRSRVRLLDKLAKQNGWRSLCIVGVKDDLEAKSLIQWCRQLDVTIVWEQRGGTRQERQRQQMGRDRMRKWTAVYKRLSLVEMSSAEAAEHLADRQFDAVALWGLSPAQLAADGAAWAALVRDGGSLVGTGHRLPEVRGILNAAVDKWRQLRDGVWLVDVRRTAEEPPVSSDSDGEELLADAPNGATAVERPTEEEPEPLVIPGLVTIKFGRKRGVEHPAHGDIEVREVSKADAAGAHDSATSDVAAPATLAQPAPKRRGGRPKGSRNKPKAAAE